MDSLELIKNKFKSDNYAKRFDIVLDALEENFVKMHMKLTPEMNNFHGRPHGGAIYALADAAFSIIGNNQNNISVALDCNIYYHASPNPGEILYVKGERLKQSQKIGTYLFTVYTEVNGKQEKIATMTSNLYRTGKPYDPNLEVG
jgi:acyl-CoA thioesterase